MGKSLLGWLCDLSKNCISMSGQTDAVDVLQGQAASDCGGVGRRRGGWGLFPEMTECAGGSRGGYWSEEMSLSASALVGCPGEGA